MSPDSKCNSNNNGNGNGNGNGNSNSNSNSNSGNTEKTDFTEHTDKKKIAVRLSA